MSAGAPPQPSRGGPRHLVTYGLLAVAAAVGVSLVVAHRLKRETAEAIGTAAPRVLFEPTIALPTAAAARSVDELREEGERAVEQLMQRFPESAGALHIAAVFFAEVNQHDRAAELWERAVAREPKYAGPRVGLARVAMERGDDAAAIAILENALAAGCRTVEAFERLATALQKLGRLEAAEAAARQGVAAFPQAADLWLLLGQIQLQRDQLPAARASLHEALRRQPDSGMAHFALATVCARLGESEQAAEHRERFAQLKAEHPLDQQRFQVVYEAVLRRLVATTLSQAAAEYQRQGDAREAERLYLHALTLAPGDADTYRWLASLYHGQGRLGDARLAQQRLVAVEPQRVENYLNLASLLVEVGQPEAAEAALAAALDVAPDAAAAYCGLAGLYLQRGQSRQARQLAEQAIQRAPSADGYRLLAAACEQMGDLAEAQAAAREADRLARAQLPRGNTPP